MNLKIITVFKLAIPKKSIQYLSSEEALPRGLKWKDYKGEQGKFRVDGNIHYLDCGFVLISVYMSKFIKVYTVNRCTLLYVKHNSIKPLKIKKNYLRKL